MNKEKTLCLSLFIFNFVSFIALFVFFIIFGETAYFSELKIQCYFWIILLFAIVPLLSIICGFVFLKAGTKKNIISGFIILSIYLATVVIIFPYNCGRGSTHIIEINMQTGLNLPTKCESYFKEESNSKYTYIKLLDCEIKNFESTLTDETRWTSNFSSDIEYIMPKNVRYQYQVATHFCSYVFELNSFNPAHLSNGTYRIDYVFYNINLKALYVAELSGIVCA